MSAQKGLSGLFIPDPGISKRLHCPGNAFAGDANMSIAKTGARTIRNSWSSAAATGVVC